MYDSYSIYLEASVAGYIYIYMCNIHTQKHHIRSKNKIAHDDILLNSDKYIYRLVLTYPYIYTYITENGCTECT